MRVSYVLPVAWTALCGVASADPCQVTIARAPAELRAALDSALAAEPHCRVPLELRAVATEGGYYLLARDFQGRTRERIVPDAASAATLVASWAADDEIDDATAHAAPPAAPTLSTQFAPPSSVDVAPPAAATAPPVRGPHVGGYVMAGAGGGGLRGDLDVVRRGRWAVGVAASRRTGATLAMVDDEYILGPMTATEYDVVGYAAYERDLGDAWHVRGTLGAGAAIVDATLVEQPQMPIDGVAPSSGGIATVPLVDGTLSIAADVGLGFSLVAGVLLTEALDTPTVTVAPTPYYAGATADVPPSMGLSFSVFAGLRYEL